MPLPVEVVPVARQTVLIVDALPIGEVRRQRVGMLAQRVFEPRQGDRFAAERDLRGRSGMDRAEVGRRRDRGLHLTVGNETDQHRHHHQHAAAHGSQAWLHQHGRDRLLEALPPLLAVAHIDQHAHEDRGHVLEHDAFRDDGASRQEGHDPHDHHVGHEQDSYGLPERVLGVAPHSG